MDPFEEFEFKPLTEGLGFHKKKAAAKFSADVDSEFAVSKPGASFQTTTESFLKDQGLGLIEEENVDPLRPPLPRKSTSLTIEPETSPSSSAVDEILKTLQNNRRLDFDNTQKNKANVAAAVAANKTEEFVKDTWNFSSALLDGMLVIAASLLCMIIVLMITKADLIANLANPDAEGMVYLATFGLVAVVSFIYLTINRVFMGCTPGEWAFEQRVGKPQDMTDAGFLLKVIGRSFLVILTGFIILPIASLLMNKDLAGEITGAQIFRKA